MKSSIHQFSFLIVTLILIQQAKAQDLIITKNGDEIPAKVTEIGLEEIKYHRYDNLDGPIYTIEKSQVFMIRYENGKKDVFNLGQQAETQEIKLDKPMPQLVPLEYKRGIRKNGVTLKSEEVLMLYMDVPEAKRLYESGKALSEAGQISQIGILLPVLFVYVKTRDMTDPKEREACAALGCGAMASIGIFSLVLGSSGIRQMRKSVEIYNQYVSFKQSQSPPIN